jgi:hypothetical protein
MRPGLGLLALALAAGACKSDKNNGTMLMVEVTTDLIMQLYDKIEVEALPDSGKSARHTFDIGPNLQPPVRLAVVPEGDPDRGLEVIARALLGSTPVVEVTAALRFNPGVKEEVTLVLSRECRVGGTGRTCNSPQQCVPGACVPKDRVAIPRPYLVDASAIDGPPADRPPDLPGVDQRPREVGAVTGTWMMSDNVAAAALQGVFAVSATEVWAVGSTVAGVALAFRYDGTDWRAVPLPPTMMRLNGVWASGPEEVWVAGEAGLVARRTAGNWMVVPSGSTATITGVWGSGPSDVWFVGNGNTALRWNGSAIAPASAGITTDLLAVSGSSATDVWAVGLSGSIYRLTGSSWTRQMQNHGDATLFSVWAGSSSDVWAVGSNSTALHFDGISWARLNHPLASAQGVWGAADNQVWTVGRATAGGGGIAHFDGNTWDVIASPTGPLLQAVHGRAADDIWAVGGNGIILRYR